MNFKRLAVIGIFLMVLSGFASSAMVANSESWKDNSIVIAQSHFQDEEVHAVTSLSEGQLIEEMLLQNQSHTVYEPQDGEDAVWENYANYLRNQGKTDISSSFLNWQESQYDYYSDVEDQVEGFVVLRPGFAVDTISVFPQITNADYWPIYYDGDRTESFLQSQASDKDVIFYGEFMEQPWRGLDSNYSIISEGSKTENNKALVRQLTTEFRKESAIVAGDSYLEKGFMKKGDPVIVADDLEGTAQLIEDMRYSNIEIIGAENVNFGNNLEDRVGNDTTVIAKFGRRFTGAQGLDSTYPVKQIPATPVTRQVSVTSVKIDGQSANQVELVFENEGTIETMVNLSAVSFTGEGGEEIISNEKSLVLRPGRNATIDFNSSIDFEPETAEISYTYTGNDGMNSRNYDVDIVDAWESSDISLEDLYYSETQEKIGIDLRNRGQSTTYAGAQIRDLRVINKSLNPVTDQVTEIQPGETATVYVDAYMSEEDIERNSNLDLALTAGDTSHTAKDLYELQEVELQVREGGIIVIVTQYGPYVLIVLLVLLLLYMLKRRKEKDKYRGLK